MYTKDEFKAMVAPVVGIPMEDIDDIIIIVRGNCTCCDNRDAITVGTSLTETKDALDILRGAVVTTILREEFPEI